MRLSKEKSTQRPTVWVEPVRFPPEPHEHLLDDLLGKAPIDQHPPGEGEDGAAVPPVELGQGVVIPPGDADH